MTRIKILAGLAILAAFAGFVWHQQAEITRLTGELSTSNQALADRIMSEDRHVIEAFELGRKQQARELQKQKEVLDALEDKNRAAAGDLAHARERVRRELASAAGNSGSPDLPGPDPQGCEAIDAYRSRVLTAAGELVDGVLQVGSDADEAARLFNALIEIDAPGFQKLD